LAKLSLSPVDLERSTLLQEFERIIQSLGIAPADHERKRLFNQLLRDLENDFYVVEASPDQYDFASGLLKDWWRKYYA
jgi:predicted lipid carrier protein YhbT